MIEETKNYEIAFLVKFEADREELIKNLKANQFSIIGEGQISRIKLAFPIKKENFAYFGYLHFSGDPKNIKNLSDEIKTEAKILRSFIIPQPPKESEVKIPEGISSARLRRFSERREIKEIPLQSPTSQLAKKQAKTEVLSNEALEKKLEEILK